MLTFPNAKINLGLSVIAKRSDGYHDIDSFIVPIALCDALEIIENPEKSGNDIFTISGLTVDVNTADNLVAKAVNLLRKDYHFPTLKIHLHKHIPMGAGLGGGSADAAFTLKLVNEKLKLGISNKQLENYARQLGSDCALFIANQPVLVSGRGDILTPVIFDLKNYKIKLVHPNIHISTAEAYNSITPKKPEKEILSIIKQPMETWKDYLFNDFETFAFTKYPELKNIKDQLYTQGAVYAAMSGSGSSIFGIFSC